MVTRRPTAMANFLDIPYWTQNFVGTGPYRMGGWVLDSHMVLQAFDSYILGRPKMDASVLLPLLGGREDLQVVAFRVTEVNTVRIASSTCDLAALGLEPGLHLFVLAGREAERHVVHLAPRVNVATIAREEQRDLLIVATPEKTLAVAFMGDCHSEHVDIEAPRARQIANVKHDVIDTGYLERRLDHLIPPFGRRLRGCLAPMCHRPKLGGLKVPWTNKWCLFSLSYAREAARMMHLFGYAS